MARSSPLEMLIEIQDDRVETALAEVADSQQTLNQAKEQLDTLYSFQTEYEQRFREESKVGIQPVHLHNYHAFISKLYIAIEQQTEKIKTLEKKVEEKQQIWLEEKNQLNAYKKLKERQDREKAKIESKREQKLSDEFGAKKYRDKQKEQLDGEVSM